MSSERCSVAIVGAGVVGCAVAKELAARGRNPWVLEQGPRIAEGVTSRNSGVVHGGIYYPPGSLKAESCNRGRERLYEWCARTGVNFRRTGKWIIGDATEESELEALQKNAEKSGARVRRGTIAEIRNALPGIRAEIGLFSPDTGIVDPAELCRSLRMNAEENGATFLTDCAVTGIEALSGGGYRLLTVRGPIDADWIVNVAGLHSDEIARLAKVEKYRIYPCRGEYFRIPPLPGIDTLIYPVKKKNSPGLGIHLTLGLDGSHRLGPDAVYVESKNDFSPPSDLEAKRDLFLRSAKRFIPGLRETDLQYDSCGIRPKLRAPHETAEKDFVLSEDAPALINLVGIESPGLTGAMDLAQRVSLMIRG